MTRWKAASIHLAISVLIGLLVFALLFLVWYPQPYFVAAGGKVLIVLILAINLILGPLLTLIAFKSGKTGLYVDLCVIGVLQLAALLFGLYVSAGARPTFVVAAVDRFSLVSANEIDPNDLSNGSKAEFRFLSWTGPRLVGTRLPPPGEERTELIFQSVSGGKDVQHYPKYYVDYETVASDVLAHARSLDGLRAHQPGAGPRLDAWLKDRGRTEAEVVWVPVMARKSSLVMLLDARTGEVLDALPIYPW